MAIEKRLKAVPLQLFIVDGTSTGKVIVVNTRLFKVKQKVFLKSSTQPNTDNLEIKRILSQTEMLVGPEKQPIHVVSDLSMFLVANGASIGANEQLRPSIPTEEINRAVYEEEPTVAYRVVQVDELGAPYNTQNRIPVEASINLSSSKPNQHTVFNKLILLANTETSIVLPNKTEIITIMVRGNKASKLQYSFVFGESGTNFITVMPGVRKEISGIGLNGPTPLYVQLSLTEVGGTMIEVETWSS